MYFRSEPLRLQFEEAARREGFAIGSAVDREMSELPYGVILHIICPLKNAALMRSRCLRYALRSSSAAD